MMISKISRTLLAVSAFFPFTSSAPAITIVQHGANAAAWPGSPQVEALDNTQDNSRWQITPARDNAQSFKVPQAFTVESIYQEYQIQTTSFTASASNTFRFSIFEVADVNAATLTPGTTLFTSPIMDTTSFPTGSSTDTTNRIVEFQLDVLEQFTLTPLGGTAGYALQFDWLGPNGYQWTAIFPNPDTYLDGETYISNSREDGNDFTLAMTGPAASLIPEPGTFALAALGLLGISSLTWRRRKRTGGAPMR